MMSLVSQTLLCRAPGHGKFCTGVADEVQKYGSSRACERERGGGRLPVERMELMAFIIICLLRVRPQHVGLHWQMV